MQKEKLAAIGLVIIIVGAYLIRMGRGFIGGIIVILFSFGNLYVFILIYTSTIWVYLPIALGIVAIVLGVIAGISSMRK